MSAIGSQKRLTPTRISAMKGGKPIVCLTAYTTPMARLLDEHCDLLLVGDSLGMVLYLSLIHISEPTDRQKSRMPSSA